jgi:LytTr DNA-binding domain-containing protein
LNFTFNAEELSAFFNSAPQTRLMRSFLLQPYPFGRSVFKKLSVCAGIGLFVALFLGVFKPFGMHSLAPSEQWLHALLFGLVTFVVSSLCQVVLPRLLPRVFAEEHWKSWKEILFLLFIVFCVSAGNYWLAQVLYNKPDGGRPFYYVLSITGQVGIFPVVFIVFMKQMRLYRQYAAEALEVNRQMQTPEASIPTLETAVPTQVVLQGEGQRERLELPAGEILFISSSDNYVQVFHSGEGAIRSPLLRSSLKNMEQQLSAFPSFFRCHRLYLVNLDLVERVSGNAQGLRLHLKRVEEPVPVSRSLTQTVKERLSHLSHSPQTA